MRSKRWLWVLSVWSLMLGIGVAQPPLLVLTNGDVNGDNLVDDTDLLAVIFRMGDSCPQGCAEDLNGDLTVDDSDLLTVNFHMGAQGAPAFAGQVSAPQGAFRVALRLQLGDWAGASQSVKVQLKPVGREGDASVPIYEWTVSVGGAETEVELDNLPAGVYTVRAYPVASGRWLRTEGKIVTEVPWVFAAPTGANKVTVYWDGVPGATGYRVRWGVQSGVYPNASGVLPAGARRHTVEGLVSEQEYYFVVEAEYNGLWSPPSEEDSAVPHEGAIPWDSGDASVIVNKVRLLTGSFADYDLIDVISPEGRIYTDSRSYLPNSFFDITNSAIVTYPFGDLIPVTEAKELQNTRTGPYRLVKARQGFVGVQGSFWVPSAWGPRFPYEQIRITQRAQDIGSLDTPCAYFGFSSGHVDVEGGLMYHPVGRREISYGRWQAYLKIVDARRSGQQPVIEDSTNQRGHIVDNPLSGGTEVFIQLNAYPKAKFVSLLVVPIDPILGAIFRRQIGGAISVRNTFEEVSFRRVFSIAQKRDAVFPLWGYARTGSFVSSIGLGFNPIETVFTEPPAQLTESPLHLFWSDWTPTHTILQGSFPNPNSGIVSWSSISPFLRETCTIVLPQ